MIRSDWVLRMTRTTMAAAAILLSIVSASICGAAPKEGEKKKPSSLDDQLLDDLGGELLEGLEGLPKESGDDAEKPTDGDGGPPETTTDQRLLDQLIGGEDVELGGAPKDPFVRLGQRMRRAGRMIGEGETSQPTQQLQREIVDEIALLIEKLKKQKKQSSKQSSQQGRPKPGPRKREPGDQPSNKPAEDSEDRVGESSEVVVETPEMQDFIREVWGHLPERVRQQMQNASVERFLPKYEKLIEEYYKRLAEDAADYP